MLKIRILPEILSNKIAAGEVVERPASVVKELVENAIDAGSSRIMVEVENGGRKLIRVSDNGHGMGRDDALLCLERYATSKIAKDPDLFAISTLGFRGEALPSIAAVSRFTLITRTSDSDVGTRIEVAGGRINTVTDEGAPAGTMIGVANLFYNTPARRKFLKSIETEMGHIADTIASMALCRSSVQFRLSHNGRVVKSWAPAADPTDRVADVLGGAVKKALHPVAGGDAAAEVSGWVAEPRMSRSTARGIYLFVNGRWVKDRVLQHALFAGYAGRLMKGQYPVAVLFLRVPFDQVDVNVHPTKHEIRFARQKRVHDAVREAVAEALRQTDPTRWHPPQTAAVSNPRTVATVADRPISYEKRPIPRMPEASTEDRPFPAPAAPGPATPALDSTRPHQPVQTADGDNAEQSAASRPSPADPPARQAPLWKRRFFSDLHLIGQYKGTYIICESGDDGLILIDQHAAHERIVFEQLKRQAAEQRPTAQRLLLPETIDLGFREAQILATLVPQLDRYGLEIEPFGGNTFVVKAMPTQLDSGKISTLVTQLVEKTAEIGVRADTDAIMDGCLMVMACHNAIRAHQRLSEVQIKAMLEQLDDCDNPSHCPHGRPIWIRWELKDLEKQFQRIV
ncbi:DNA mismatch repair endonuclease MutL [Desulfosarcina ovata]|uniref:DNA mismatch repair protein MutL n=1 Tax=Desulfosarcina ovata subsp. ovata TaxID=2752305 RepID=A0A5K8ADG9_9BACT|nr:DNA mismatch repair endonuclease MutL [Desulfosarcina ovata]BBO89990.1 DNA mismatch repair protein MutL [Desulfosarcina ovata subsp. ovata]